LIFTSHRCSPFGAWLIVVISESHWSQLVTGGGEFRQLFILGCVLSWVAYSLIGKIAMRRLSPLASVSYSALIGAAALFVPAVFYDDLASNLRHASLIDWTSIVYLAVCGTVIGFVWYYEGVKAIGPTRAGLFINFVPISARNLAPCSSMADHVGPGSQTALVLSKSDKPRAWRRRHDAEGKEIGCTAKVASHRQGRRSWRWSTQESRHRQTAAECHPSHVVSVALGCENGADLFSIRSSSLSCAQRSGGSRRQCWAGTVLTSTSPERARDLHSGDAGLQEAISRSSDRTPAGSALEHASGPDRVP
jgi:hypothetical protein